MIEQLSWKVGGQQGEGIESTGEIFSTALNRLGYYLYGYRHFSSRIKGGHTNNKIRVSTKPVRAVADDLDILVAFDQETIDFNFHELHSGGIVIADAKFDPAIPEGTGVALYAVPFTDIATELGNPLMKNMVAIGATSAVLGLDAAVFESVVADTFARKGAQVVAKNMEAIRAGARYMEKQLDGRGEPMKLAQADGKQRLFMIGNDAIALGALAGGARLMAAYPITPASEIMEYLIKALPRFGGDGHSDRRRNRCLHDGDRCQLRGRAGVYRFRRTGVVADGRSDRTGRDDGNAACGCRYPAGRSEHGLADEARTVGLAGDDLRNARGNPENRHGAKHGRRSVLRHGGSVQLS